MKKKYAMTLLEIMIVIFIIGIIGSVIGYNMRGSLDQGKAFKTKEAARKLYEIVLLEEANNNKIDKDVDLEQAIATVLKKSDLVRRPKDLMKDGWGETFDFEFVTLKDNKEELRFSSHKYDTYCEKKKTEPEYPWDEDKDEE